MVKSTDQPEFGISEEEKGLHLLGADAVVIGTVLSDGPCAELYVDVLHTASGMVIGSANAALTDENMAEAIEEIDKQVCAQYPAAISRAVMWMKDKPRNSTEAISLARQALERTTDLKGDALKKVLPESMRLIDVALAMGPDSVDVQNCAGWIYRKAGDYERAERAFSQAVTLAPNAAFNYFNYGTMLRRDLKDDARAEPLLRRAVELEGDGPEMPAYRLQLAIVMRNLGRDDEAIALLESTMDHWNTHEKWDRCEVLARLLEKKGQWRRVAELREIGTHHYSGKNKRVTWKRAEEAYERLGDAARRCRCWNWGSGLTRWRLREIVSNWRCTSRTSTPKERRPFATSACAGWKSRVKTFTWRWLA